MDRRYGKDWIECAFIHMAYYVIMPFLVIGLILLSPFLFLLHKYGPDSLVERVDCRSAEEMHTEDRIQAKYLDTNRRFGSFS